MFKYFIIEDTVTLSVSEYADGGAEVLRERLSDKYVDKVIYGVGLGVLVRDIITKSEPSILPTDGRALYKVGIRLLVFSPSRDEIITGKLIASDVTGLTVSLGFFSDIRVIPDTLEDNFGYDSEVKRWWRRCDNDERSYYLVNENIQFKVVEVIYDRKSNDCESAAGTPPVMLVLGMLPDH